MEVTGVLYTFPFICPYRKKSQGVISGDRGGQGTGLPRPIQLFGLLRFKQALVRL